ncbi:MAG: hypothetical protein COT92_03590 [Candidatus Doudnabacteria bacterium CG10_big_fil_rev_8_21_14_0_10_42_18]|uniref:Cell envelope-related transcriptional attenuator domain-containing protein n=1 Tax=Candidatus Doudnabacteria bacterium CG10_big_fil_rev_8_21_14_0_10_42_18 TaxID=1974552 RepID=A0A2H0VA47_9BACT|nr:MAG: hypothetical protein COT92_03590 [Candidatus Doudnabacteria bacterium CG10_big_fil_rev_8_21_14_0_10_42_18]
MKPIDSIGSPVKKPSYPKTEFKPFVSPAKKKSEPRPNFYQTLNTSAPKKQISRKILKIGVFLIALAIIILGGLAVIKAANISGKIFVGQKTTFFQKIKDALRGGGGEIKLVGEDINQINILLLGIGGEGHDGPYLSDTIILAQVRPDIDQVALTSIPRDYLINLPENLGQRKINAAFAEGLVRRQDWNEAGRFAREAVEKISGLTVPYFAVMDFSGFEKALDEIDGLDVYIDRTFTDYTFPNNNGGYLPPLTFEKGWEHMDGKRALQFVRSRHAGNGEGSDFARSQRQQKVIQAFKDKILNIYDVSNVGRINGLLNVFADHFHTNISPGEILRMYNIAKGKDIQSFLSVSLDLSTGLICPKILEDSGAYVLVPCAGKDEQDIKNFFKNMFSLGLARKEQSVVWLASSSGDALAYEEAARAMAGIGLTVFELPYKPDFLPSTIFYQVNPKPGTAEYLKNNFEAKEVSLPPPGVNINPENVDIIIILKENYE